MRIKKEYRSLIPSVVNSLGLATSEISFVISDNEFGGKIISIESPILNPTFFVKARIMLGKKTQVYKDIKGYIFHELSHVIHFSYLMVKNKVKDFSELLFYLSENPYIIPLSEIIAEVLTAIKGGFIDEVRSREFSTWKWWKTQEAFDMSKELICYFYSILDGKRIDEIMLYFTTDKEPIILSKKLYGLMRK